MVSNSCKRDGVWRSLEIDGKTYNVCFANENDSWKVILTDLAEIWVENLTHETMFRKCQTLNPLLKPLETFNWQQRVMDMLSDIPKHVVEASISQIKLRKELEDLDFVKLKFSLDLVKGTPQQFSENVMMPLCLSLMEMVRQHEILLDLVRKKDEEIAEYKAGGAELIRKYIATEPFSEELFRNDTNVPVATDFAKAFQLVLNSCNAITSPKTHVKVEPEEKVETSNDVSDDISRINEIELAGSPKDELMQETKQDESDEDDASKKNKCKPNPSTRRSSILKLNNTSHSIQKSLQKQKRKTLSDLIS